MHDEGSSVCADHLWGRLREYGQGTHSICYTPETQNSDFHLLIMGLLLNHSDHNRTACGTLSIVYVPSSVTPQVEGGMKRMGKCWCKVPKLEADKLLKWVACCQKRSFIRIPNLTSHVATTKDHPQRLFVESVADCRTLHVPLFLLITKSYGKAKIFESKLWAPSASWGHAETKERFLLAELASQETLNPVGLTLTHSLPSCMDIPLSLKMLHQKELFC